MKYSMDSWAREVKSLQEIPESFGSFFDTITAEWDGFPYTVFAPPDKWYLRKVNPKMLCVFDDRIYIAEKVKKQIKVTCFRFQDIHYIETGTLLLHSWLKINGIANDKFAAVSIEYNTVVEGIFRKIVEMIRNTVHILDQSEFAKGQLKKEQHKFDTLIQVNFKYMNFGKRSILPGEQIRQFILQPDIRVKLLKYFQRTVSFTHLLILTGNELIIVQDDDSSKMTQPMRYGGIWKYIPLEKIVRITMESNPEENLVRLTVCLAGEVSLHLLYSSSQIPVLELLIKEASAIKIVA